MSVEVLQKPFTAAIHEVRQLAEGAFILRFDREGLKFQPGQHLHVGRKDTIHRREYSIYSPETADYLEVLIKEVDGGLVTGQLKTCQAGDSLYVKGPFGGFTLEEDFDFNRPVLFIATGSGIAPFHCLAGSYPKLNYHLIHGIRLASETYEHDHYPTERVTACVSRENGGDFHGRVTDWLRENPVTANTRCFICGNSDMIYEVFDILRDQNIPREQITAEIYF